MIKYLIGVAPAAAKFGLMSCGSNGNVFEGLDELDQEAFSG